MHITNNVERAMFMLQIIPQRCASDTNLGNSFFRPQHKHMPETFPLQTAQGSPQFVALPCDHMGAKVAVRSCLIALVTNPFWHIQYNHHWQRMISSCEGNQRL